MRSNEENYWLRPTRAYSRRSILRGAALAAAAIAGAGALGCRSATSTTGGTSGAQQASATSVSGPSGDAAFQKQWSDLVAAAKEEKELVAVLGPDTAVGEAKIFDHFGQQFGVKVTQVGGNSTDVTNRILAERSQGLYTVDIAALGGGGTQRILQANDFAPLVPYLFAPEAVDRSTGWYVNYIPWETDDTQMKFVTDYALGVATNFSPFYYNTKNVSAAEVAALRSWNDLLNPRWKGKIIIGDLSNKESEGAWTTAWLYLGQTYLDQFLRTKPAVDAYGDARTYSDGLARGQWDLGLFPGGSEQAIITAQQQGLPVAAFPNTLKEGTTAAPTRGLSVMDHPAHPNLSKLFVNWYLTRDGQTVFNQLNERPGEVALRNDVPQGKVANDLWARATAKDLKIINTNTDAYRAAQTASQAWVKQEFQQLGLHA